MHIWYEVRNLYGPFGLRVISSSQSHVKMRELARYGPQFPGLFIVHWHHELLLVLHVVSSPLYFKASSSDSYILCPSIMDSEKA